MTRSLSSAVLLTLIAMTLRAEPPISAPDHPPIEPAPAPDALQLNKSLLKYVEDDAPVRGVKENPDEALAYDYVVRFAKDVTLESFRKAAIERLTFADLLGPEAASHRGSVAHVEGRLKRIRDIGPTTALEADGVKNLYECWIVSEAYRGYSWCLICTELPADLTVGDQLDARVSFDAYFYKIYRFRTDDGARKAPLMIGRSLTTRPVPSLYSAETSGLEAIVAIGVTIGVVLVVGVGLIWWYRRDDLRTKERLRQARGLSEQPPPTFHENPFGGSPSLN